MITINNTLIETFKFSGGEIHVKIPELKTCSNLKVKATLNSSDEIMQLLLTVDAIRRNNINAKINLNIPYFPYARQDRVCNEGESLSVKVMADLINSMQLNSITIVDPHSDVTPALLNSCLVTKVEDIIANSNLSSVIQNNNLCLLSPDAGAEKKVHLVAKKITTKDWSPNVICASKIRETATGKILSTEIHGDAKNKKLIIIDDICDGGRTFIEIAKKLKSHNSSEIYLYVTHGIFSNGLELLKSYFKHIYCYHTMLDDSQIDPSFLTILNSKR